MLGEKIEEMYFDRRTIRILKNNGISTVKQLLSLDVGTLIGMEGMTINAMQDIRECMMCYSCLRSSYHESTCLFSNAHGNRYVFDCNSRSCVNRIPVKEKRNFFEHN